MVAWLRNSEFLKKSATHITIVMLARVDDFKLKAIGVILKSPDNWGNLHKVWPSSGDKK
jgi:hypothetical protein